MKWRLIIGLVLISSGLLGNTIRLETERMKLVGELGFDLTHSELIYAIDNLNLDSLSLDEETIKKALVRKKIIAVSLAVTLGVFGVHRLYLGTEAKVPIIYTLTLGGGFGVLVVSDIIAILSAKDLTPYSPNEKVFMWAK
jgi:TM2 domain-containing membrane protein YozV